MKCRLQPLPDRFTVREPNYLRFVARVRVGVVGSRGELYPHMTMAGWVTVSLN